MDNNRDLQGLLEMLVNSLAVANEANTLLRAMLERQSTVDNHRAHRPKVQVKVPYDGSSNPMIIDAFLNELRAEMLYYRIENETDKMLIFGQNLVGSAQNWFSNLVGPNYDAFSFEEIIKMFKQRYYPTNVREGAIDDFIDSQKFVKRKS